MDTRKAIESGQTVLGVEFGSTRIKAVLIGEDQLPIAWGSHEWENQLRKWYLDVRSRGCLDRIARIVISKLQFRVV